MGPEAVDELISMQLNVGVLLVRPNGQVALPHNMCESNPDFPKAADALGDFVSRLKQVWTHGPSWPAQSTTDAIRSPRRRLLFLILRAGAVVIEGVHSSGYRLDAGAARILSLLAAEICVHPQPETQDRLVEPDVAPLVVRAGLKLPDIDDYFSDLSKLSHSSLRQYACIYGIAGAVLQATVACPQCVDTLF